MSNLERGRVIAALSSMRKADNAPLFVGVAYWLLRAPFNSPNYHRWVANQTNRLIRLMPEQKRLALSHASGVVG